MLLSRSDILVRKQETPCCLSAQRRGDRKLNRNKKIMLKSTDILLIITLALEAAVIIIGNTFTIFIFCTQRSRLKRTCFLLVNLAIADLLVGIAEPIVLGTEKIPKMKMIRVEDVKRIKNPSLSVQILGSSTSVIFLALISLERVHAVLRPLQHHVTSTRVYISTIIFSWTAGLCLAGSTFLPMHTEVDSVYVSVAIHSLLFLCVLIICASYLTIRTRLHSVTPPEIEIHNQRSMDQNVRLSRTFFIVAAVSLVLWLPAIAVYTTKEFCKGCVSPMVLRTVNCLHLANSMINPFVYCLRMPIFKNALKKYCRRRSRAIEPGTVHFSAKNKTVVAAWLSG